MDTYIYDKILVRPDAEYYGYSGRIETADPEAPVFAWACSSVSFRMKGKEAVLLIENRHSYYENSLGVLVDGEYRGKIVLHDGDREMGEDWNQFSFRLSTDNVKCLQEEHTVEKEGIRFYDLSAFLDGEEHLVTVYKRMDACHYFTFHGILTQKESISGMPPRKPLRRIEVYGDSVSCGEVSEAVLRCGMDDPDGHNGKYSNSFYSYSWILARKLGAELHDVSQGGISLMDGDGYFNGPDCTGMLSCYDKTLYHPGLGKTTPWDSGKYIPHVVIVAIGQNDAHPVNHMGEDYDGAMAKHWREEYRRFLELLRTAYPKAQIILTTTILGHDPAWDRAIGQVAEEMNSTDGKVHHFLYSQNGCGTSGHIRRPEAERMAEEMKEFIESLGEGVWANG